MSKYLCLVFLLLAVAIVNSQLPTRQLGSKTRYVDVFSPTIETPGSTPSKAILITRHGSCSSTSYVNEEMRLILKKLKEKIKANNEKFGQNVQQFLEWSTDKYDFKTNEEDKDLLKVGVEEIKNFASRVKKAFPTLFEDKYDNAKYPVTIIPHDRVRKSSAVFLKEIFGASSIPDKLPECSKKDIVFSMEHARAVDPHNNEFKALTDKELEEFKKSQDFTKVRQRFANIFGLKVEDIDYGIVQAMFETCRWDRLYYDSDDIIPCQFFEKEDIETMVQVDDQYWWAFASRSVHPFNAKLSCGLFDHILSFLKSDNGPIVPMYFINRSNILVLHEALGLDPKKEVFTSSITIPFMANFMAVVYPKDNTEVVGIYFNETLTPIKLLDGTICEFCELSKVIDKLESYLTQNKCNEFASKAVEIEVAKDAPKEEQEARRNEYVYSKPSWVKV